MHNLRHIHRLSIFLFSAIVIFLLAAPGTAAQYYKWQDQNGHWHFSDAPPEDNPTESTAEPATPESGQVNATGGPNPEMPTAHTAAPDTSTENDAASNQGGLFWRIKKPGLRPSHLLGTIHIPDTRVINLRPAVSQALDGCDRFVMEMEMDASAMTAMGTRMMLTDGTDLKGLIGAELYAQVVGAMAGLGLPETAVRSLKPWAVMTMLSMPKPTAAPILDLVLYQRAATAGKPTAGLETADEQLAVFEGLSMADQISLLKGTLAHLALLPVMFEQLIDAYADDNLQQIGALATAYAKDADTAATNRFMFRLNDERNIRMAQRMVPYLDRGNSFIAVGALHLAGPGGLIALLRQRGYQVTPVQ